MKFRLLYIIFSIIASYNFTYADTLITAPTINTSATKFTTASENYLPFLPEKLNQQLMQAPKLQSLSTSKTYLLPATPATTQWGVFNKDQPPVLKIKSGDSVSIETAAASDNQVVPGVSIETVAKMNNAVPGRGPHTLTGPIYVEGADPGDIVRIKFNKIIPRSYASNNNLPGKGLLPEKFPKGQIKYFYLDVHKMQMVFAPGIVVPLHPFPGTIAVARNAPGKFNSIPPGNFGGNMDLPIMTEGTILYLPVFVKGALIWTGDSHAGQGNGEINLTAIETAFSEFNITVDVIKHKHLSWPLVETPDSFVTVGYDRDLNKALDLNIQQSINLIMLQQHVPFTTAKTIFYHYWNCPLSEVVDEVNGTYCIIPKNITSASPINALPKNDTRTQYVTVAKNLDAMQAMKEASFAMITKIVKEKKLTALDAYSLCSIAMDCRIAPYVSGSKEVHCMLNKNLWIK
jgi:acetamidase/formamidase